MRILISTPFLGGAGGIERLVFELCRAFDSDEVDVVYRSELGGELAALGPKVTTRSHRSLRYRGSESSNPALRMLCRAIIDPIRIRTISNYDLEIQLGLGARISESTRARSHVLNPCGTGVDIPGDFDLIWWESPAAEHAGFNTCPSMLVAPPCVGITDPAEPVEGIPEQFLLTVFNPHSAVKGAADLERQIDSMPLPLVWCHSPATVSDPVPAALRAHPNIIHVVDGSHAQFRWLYENAQAYLSFSRSEGFGWAIADALVHCRAVISRPVGVLSYPDSTDDSVFLIGEHWDFDWARLDHLEGRCTPIRDLPHLSSAHLRSCLVDI